MGLRRSLYKALAVRYVGDRILARRIRGCFYRAVRPLALWPLRRRYHPVNWRCWRARGPVPDMYDNCDGAGHSAHECCQRHDHLSHGPVLYGCSQLDLAARATIGSDLSGEWGVVIIGVVIMVGPSAGGPKFGDWLADGDGYPGRHDGCYSP